MGKLAEKFMDFFVGETYEEFEETVDEKVEPPKDVREVREVRENREPNTENQFQSRKGAVISLHSTKQFRVVVMDPSNFDETQAIANNLKSGRQVVLNLENTDKDVAQRIIDFISGACFALEGHVKKIGDSVFLFAPHNVEISSEEKTATTVTTDQSSLPWLSR